MSVCRRCNTPTHTACITLFFHVFRVCPTGYSFSLIPSCLIESAFSYISLTASKWCRTTDKHLSLKFLRGRLIASGAIVTFCLYEINRCVFLSVPPHRLFTSCSPRCETGSLSSPPECQVVRLAVYHTVLLDGRDKLLAVDFRCEMRWLNRGEPPWPLALLPASGSSQTKEKTINIWERYKSFICSFDIAHASHHPLGKRPFCVLPEGLCCSVGSQLLDTSYMDGWGGHVRGYHLCVSTKWSVLPPLLVWWFSVGRCFYCGGGPCWWDEAAGTKTHKCSS